MLIFSPIIRLTLLCLAMALSVSAQSREVDRASEIKAAFALNVSRFVSWPDNTFTDVEEITLCLFENNFLGIAKNSITGQKIAGLPLIVNDEINIETITSCQIIFLAGEKFEKFTTSYPHITLQPVLVIVDNTGVKDTSTEYSEAMVSLIRKGSSIGFDVNLARVEAAKLKMSSNLLKLARNIHVSAQ
jgi:hypothetical protein